MKRALEIFSAILTLFIIAAAINAMASITIQHSQEIQLPDYPVKFRIFENEEATITFDDLSTHTIQVQLLKQESKADPYRVILYIDNQPTRALNKYEKYSIDNNIIRIGEVFPGVYKNSVELFVEGKQLKISPISQ